MCMPMKATLRRRMSRRLKSQSWKLRLTTLRRLKSQSQKLRLTTLRKRKSQRRKLRLTTLRKRKSQRRKLRLLTLHLLTLRRANSISAFACFLCSRGWTLRATCLCGLPFFVGTPCLARADGAARLRRSAAPSADICRYAVICSGNPNSLRFVRRAGRGNLISSTAGKQVETASYSPPCSREEAGRN